ncbi:MAG: hypothetical protein FWG61_08405 [Firmicutes bacterium]|nr:hypothetical protein [Bacillota bacterium]
MNTDKLSNLQEIIEEILSDAIDSLSSGDMNQVITELELCDLTILLDIEIIHEETTIEISYDS